MSSMTMRKLARDSRGTSVIELALLAPLLASMIIGMIDLSRAYSTKLQLEQAAQRAIERVQSGRLTNTLYNTVRTEAATAAGVPTSNVELEYWLECDGEKMTGNTMEEAYGQNCAAGQTYARYIEVAIEKTYVPVFSARFLGANEDGTYTLRGVSGLRVQ